jgi:hypothetical protein
MYVAAETFRGGQHRKAQRQGIVHGYVGEIALDNASTTEQIPTSAASWTPQERARDNGGLALYRTTAVTTLRDQLPNACADFCQPRAPT